MSDRSNFGRVDSPRLVRLRDGWTITGDTGRVLDATDLLWLSQSVDEARTAILIDALYAKK